MSAPRAFATLIPATLLSACIAVPVVDQSDASACKTYTKSMSLKAVTLNPNCHDETCGAAILAVSAGSVLISGSIVLTNNTVHWLEYQGVCSDSYLNTKKQNFLNNFDSAKPTSGS